MNDKQTAEETQTAGDKQPQDVFRTEFKITRLPTQEDWQRWYAEDIWKEVQRNTSRRIVEMVYSLDNKHYI